MRFFFSLRITNPSSQESKQWPQWLAVLAGSLSGIALGTQYSWPSPALPIILSDEFPVNVTAIESSYIAFVGPFGDLIGAPFGSYLADVIGRKNGILLLAVPLFTSWMIIAFSNSTLMFCIGRVVAGIAEGIFYIIFPIYIGEVTEPHIRGVVSSCLPLSLMTGVLLVSVYTPFLSIRDSSFVSAAFPILLIVCFVWMPESPYYLIMKGNMEKAKKALYFLRRCDIETDLEKLKNDIARQMSEKGTLKDLFAIKSNRKAFFIVAGVRIFQQLSGMSAWLMYTQTIFMQAGTNLPPTVSSCIYLSTQVFVTLWASVLLDKFGRRPLIIFSSFASGLFLLIGGIYFYLQDMTEIDISSFTWIPLVVMLGFVTAFCCGMCTVPPVLLGELFPATVKGKALCLICIIFALMTSGISKLFHYMTLTYGIFSSFFLFATMCFMSVMFSYCFVVETKGKTLEEIQQCLKGNDIKLGSS